MLSGRRIDARTGEASFATTEPVGLDLRRTVGGAARPMTGMRYLMTIWRGEHVASAISSIAIDAEGEVARIRFSDEQLANVRGEIGLRWSLAEIVEAGEQPRAGGAFVWAALPDVDHPGSFAAATYPTIIFEGQP